MGELLALLPPLLPLATPTAVVATTPRVLVLVGGTGLTLGLVCWLAPVGEGPLS